MDILNVGGLELLFLLGLAIIIMGPQRAVEAAGQISRMVANVRRTLNTLGDDLRAQTRDETQALRDFQDTVAGIDSELRTPFTTAIDDGDSSPAAGSGDASGDDPAAERPADPPER